MASFEQHEVITHSGKKGKNGNQNDIIRSERTENERTTFLDDESTGVRKGPKFGKRHEQVLCNFFLTFIAYSIRVSISVAIVAMTDSSTSINSDIPTYDWTDKSVILSAFFWGYILPQVGAGWLAGRYGPKWFLVGSMTICSIAGFFIPISAANFGSKGVMACRAVQGLCQGFIYPSLHSLLAKWVPRNERSWLANLLYSGGPCGTVVSMVLTGYISQTSYGWPMVFYLFSSMGLIWCAVFSYLGCNSPVHHTSITEEERTYIERSLGSVDETENSILSSLPHVSHWFFGSFFGFISDLLIDKKVITVRTSRKTMNCIGYIIPAIALVFLGNCDQGDSIQALILLTVIVGINAASLSGFFINHVDLSPNHAGLLMGICNGFANICAIMGPLLVQILVTDEEDSRQWRVIFYISAAVYIATNAIFVIFGSVNVQPWDDVRNKEGEYMVDEIASQNASYPEL